MKRILLYILLIMTVFFFAACDAFFLPPFERTNPYDSNAPVAPVADFRAKTIDANTIELSWTLPEDRAPSSLLIVRNSNAQPATIDDGTIINSGQLVPAADGLFTDTQDITENSSYWYAVWSIYSEEETAPENTDEFVFVGPVYDSAGTTKHMSILSPIIDGYVGDSGSSNYIGNLLYISTDGATYYNSLMKFDLAAISGDVSSAELLIYCQFVDTTDTLYIDPILTAWDESIDYTQTVDPNFADTSTYAYQISITSSPTTYTLDIATLVDSWINEGDNYGIKLSGDDSSTMWTEFDSLEGMTQPPTLTIQYYE